MRKPKINEQGFGHVELVIVLAVLAAVGFSGWYVASHRKVKPTTNNVTLNTAASALLKAAKTSTIPSTQTSSATTPSSNTGAASENSSTSSANTSTSASTPASTSESTYPTLAAQVPTTVTAADNLVLTIDPSQVTNTWNTWNPGTTQNTTDTVNSKSQTVVILRAKTASDTYNPGYNTDNTPFLNGFIAQEAGKQVKECAVLRTTAASAQVNMLMSWPTKTFTELVPAVTVTVSNSYQTYCTPYQVFDYGTVFNTPGKVGYQDIYASVNNPSSSPIYIASIQIYDLKN